MSTGSQKRQVTGLVEKVLVLGGRFGGLTSAYTLKRLAGASVDITLVDRFRTTYFRPSIPHIAIGVREPDEIGLDLAATLPRKGIAFEQSLVKEVLPGENSVVVEKMDGSIVKMSYDYLVVALGAHLAKERVKGAHENGYSLCEVDDVMSLRERLKSFGGGSITIGSGIFEQGTSPASRFPENFVPRADSACEGPIFEFSLMLKGYLKKRGLLDKTKITVYSPGEYLSDLSRQSRAAVKQMYGQMGVTLVEKFRLAEISKDKVVSDDGREIPSDVSVYKPPYTGHPVLKKLSGTLSDDAGFVPTDLNMLSTAYPNVYAVGDVNAGSIPKLGYLAVRMGEIAAEHLANRLGVPVKVEKYKPTIFCVADNPCEGYAVAVADDTWYGGSLTRAEIAPVNHMKKELFTKYYMWSKGDMVLEKYLASW